MTRNAQLTTTISITMVGAMVFLLAGCGTVGVRPDDQSYGAHMKEARKADLEAKDQARLAASTIADPTEPQRGNPHAGAAYELRHHARQHRAAAGKLKARHELACKEVSEEQMKSCPLMSATVARVEDIERGVRVIFADGTGPDPMSLSRHAACHAAHGAYWGREGMPGCPLYVKGITTRVIREGGHTVLTLTTNRPEELPLLRSRAHAFAK